MSVLRIHSVSPRDAGEIRCTASVVGKGPSISCTAKLRLNRSLHNLDGPASKYNSVDMEVRSERFITCTRSSSLRKTRRDVPSQSPRNQRYELPMRARSSSLPLKSPPNPKQPSPLPTRKNIPPSPLLNTRNIREDKTSRRKEVCAKKLESKVVRFDKKSKGRISPSSGEEEENDTSERILPPNVSSETSLKSIEDRKGCARSLASTNSEFCKTENDSIQCHDNCNKHDDVPIMCTESAMVTKEANEPSMSERNYGIQAKEERVTAPQAFVAVAILKVPADVTVFRGNRVVLRVTYQGHPATRQVASGCKYRLNIGTSPFFDRNASVEWCRVDVSSK